MSRTINADLSPTYARIIATALVFPTGGSVFAVATGRVYLSPFQIECTVTIDRIGITYGGTCAGNLKVAIYRDNGDTPLGGALLLASAGDAKAGTTRKQEITVTAIQLTPGLYWLAFTSDEATTSILAHDTAAPLGGTLLSYYYDKVYANAFTNPCPALTANPNAIAMFVRVRSTP